MFQSVHSVLFHVSDVARAAEWYSNLLGVKLTYPVADFPVLRIGDTEICFHLADAKVAIGKAGAVTYWRVAEFSAAVARAEAAGGILHRGPLEIEDGNTIGQIADPFGNLFGIVGPA